MAKKKRSNKPISKEVSLNMEKASEKLQSAELLYNQHFYNDSGSRSYYAIFHAIVACLRLKNVDLKQHGHNYIINQFRGHFLDTDIFDRSLQGKILNIKSNREMADYSNIVSLSEEDAKMILEDANHIVELIKKFLFSEEKD